MCVTVRSILQPIRPVLRFLILVAPVFSISFDLWWIYRPGPAIYYNHFVALLLGSCLAFEVTQLLLLECNQTTYYSHSCLRRHAMKLYWLVLFLSGSICGVSYCLPGKIDCAILGFFTAITAIFAFQRLARISSERIQINILPAPVTVPTGQRKEPLHLVHKTTTESSLDLVTTTTHPASRGEDDAPWWKPMSWLLRIARRTSRPFRVVHVIVAILNANGAIMLAIQQRYSNPGTIIDIGIPGYGRRSVNYFCTTRSVLDPTSKPTIWFEGAGSRGIVDLLGIQHYLVLQHNFSSCSYDPPNYGWSSALPSGLKDYDLYLPALVQALGKQDEQQVFVGWDDGLKYAVKHAMADPDHTVAVIDLNAAPDGIKYLDKQRASNWDAEQKWAYRTADLSKKIDATRVILTLGFAWGLTPLMSSNLLSKNSTYYPIDAYSTYRAQNLKDPYWTMQYYNLQQLALQSFEDPYLTQTVLPDSINFYAILNSNAVPADFSSNEFYRESKLDLAGSISGQNIRELQWCAEMDCTERFPIEKAEWTAGVIAGMLGG